MKSSLLVVLTLVVFCVVLLSPHDAFADPDKEAALLKRIEQLEKRLAELEKIIKQRPSVKEAAPEKTLVGSWVITEVDKKTAADKKIPSVWTDLKMNADKSCGMVSQDDSVHPAATYHVTEIGSVTQIDISWFVNGAIIGWTGRIASITETELVLAYKTDAGWVKVRYNRKN